MRNVEQAAKAVGHAMGNAKAAVGKCQPGHAGADEHVVARGHVVAVVIGALEVGKNIADGLLRVDGGKHVAVTRGIGFHRMGQHVHAGCGGHVRGYGARKAGIKNGGVRNEHFVIQRNFHRIDLVGDNRNGGHFRTCAAGGGDGDKRGFSVAVGPAPEVGDGLCHINGRAAANGDNHVCLAAQKKARSFNNGLKRWVRFHARKKRVANALAFQMAHGLIGKSAFDHKGVCHHKGMAGWKGLKGFQRVRAVADLCFSVKLGHVVLHRRRKERKDILASAYSFIVSGSRLRALGQPFSRL